MTKKEFLIKLRRKLWRLPKQEREEQLAFYGEMIDDRIEEGLTEEEAVESVGKVDEIACQVKTENTDEQPTKKKRSGAGIALIVIGSPIWIALLVSIVAVLFSLYVCAWAVLVCLWSSVIVFIGGALFVFVSGIVFLCTHRGVFGIALIGGAFVLISFAIASFFLCKWLTKRACVWTKRIFVRTKDSRKGVA